jgi:hypothetical protein
VVVLTPTRQRSAQHSEFLEQDLSIGLQLVMWPSRVLVPGAAAARATKAKAMTIVVLKNCIALILRVMWERSRGDRGSE